MGPVGPRGFPGRDGLSTTGGPLTSTGLGIPPVFNANLSTIGMENSLHYLGESLNHVMQFQQNVNRNMVEHLNMTVKNQLLQGQALGQSVEIHGKGNLINCLTQSRCMMERTLKSLSLG